MLCTSYWAAAVYSRGGGSDNNHVVPVCDIRGKLTGLEEIKEIMAACVTCESQVSMRL